MTVQMALEPFLVYCEAEKLNAAETMKKYQECFRSWLLPVFGNRDVATLLRVDIIRFREQLVRAQLSVARQYSLLMTLKVFLKFCRSVLKLSTLDPSEITLPSRGKPEVHVLSDDDLTRMFEAIELHTFHGARLRALIELILGTGVRISEALALNREIFDQNRNEAEIVGKGGKRRTIFLTPRCMHWVNRYVKCRADAHPALFVTTGSHIRRWARADISRFFIRLRMKSGLEKRITPHILRHTYCTNLLKNGADIAFIKDLAGHEDIQTTAKYYLGVNKAMLRSVVDRCVHYESK